MSGKRWSGQSCRDVTMISRSTPPRMVTVLFFSIRQHREHFEEAGVEEVLF